LVSGLFFEASDRKPSQPENLLCLLRFCRLTPGGYETLAQSEDSPSATELMGYLRFKAGLILEALELTLVV
jgi:hypothetical protein